MPPRVEMIHHQEILKHSSSDSLNFTVSNYTIEYDHQIPNCSCPDFSKYHWPCKHVLAIFHHNQEHGWDSLHQIYKDQPCFNLDVDVLPTKSNQSNFIDETVMNNNHVDLNINTETYDCDTLTTDTDSISKNTETFDCDSPNENIDSFKPFTVRKSCIEVLKNVQNNLYGTDDVRVLFHAREKLAEIDTYLDQQSVNISGIPSRLKRKKLIRKQQSKTGKIVKKQKLMDNIIPLNSEIICQEIQSEDQDINPETIPFLKGLLILPNSSYLDL